MQGYKSNPFLRYHRNGNDSFQSDIILSISGSCAIDS